MRIGFVFRWRIGSGDGVTKKIRGQIRAWKELGHEVRAICMSDEVDCVEDADFEVVGRHTAFGVLTRPIVDWRANRRAMELLGQFSPDIVYMRQTGYRTLVSMIAGEYKTVFEINSDDLKELELRLHASRSFKTWMHFVLLKRNHARIYGSLSGIVSVTRELGELATYRDYGKMLEVVPNGIDLRCRAALPAVERGDGLPRIVFACGSYHAPWHGFSEVLALAGATVGQLEIHVVGGDVRAMDGLPSNLTCHGFLEGDAYQRVFSSCDVGLGSCGLHRIPLREACPLKMRDYLAAGLAVIVPYEDTALEERREVGGGYPEWMLKVPNGPGNLIGARESIVGFCRSWMGRRVPRSEVEPLIDVLALEKRRLSFFKSVVEGVGCRVGS